MLFLLQSFLELLFSFVAKRTNPTMFLVCSLCYKAAGSLDILEYVLGWQPFSQPSGVTFG